MSLYYVWSVINEYCVIRYLKYGIKNIFMSYTLSLWINVVIYNCITKLYIVNSERFICNQPVRSPVDLYEKYTRIYLLNSPLYVESMGLRTYSYQTFQASEFRCSLNCITLIVYCNCTSLTWSDWYVINQLEVQFHLQNWIESISMINTLEYMQNPASSHGW